MTLILQIYGLKTLVKVSLHYEGSHVKRNINGLLDILSRMLQESDNFVNITASSWYNFYISVGQFYVCLSLGTMLSSSFSTSLIKLIPCFYLQKPCFLLFSIIFYETYARHHYQTFLFSICFTYKYKKS